MRHIEYRQVQRDARCRGCNKDIVRNTEKVITWYASNNLGMYIFLCDSCVEHIYNMVKENPNEH